MMKMEEMFDRCGRLRAQMAFLIKAMTAIDALPESPLNDEESRGFELLFDMICKDLKELPIQIQRAFGSETNEKVWFSLLKS